MEPPEKVIQLADLHFEHRHWTKELEFWKDEILTFQHRMKEVENRWTDAAILAIITQFRNAFIYQSEIINALLREIGGHEAQLAEFAKEHPQAAAKQHFKDHINYRSHMEKQRNTQHELKKRFFSFLVGAM